MQNFRYIHCIRHKAGKFYCIDKTALLLVVATWRFYVFKNCLALTAFKTSANSVRVNSF